eukprot:gene11221-12400_t
MDEKLKILDIANLLQEKLIILPGGIDRDGFPILIFYDVPLNISSVDNGKFLKVIDYLCQTARDVWNSDFFTVIIDRRNSKWSSVKLLLMKLKGVSSFQIHKLLILQPTGFFQKHFKSERKELQKMADDQIVFLDNAESLFNYVDVRHLPDDLSGVFTFNHLEWVEHRTAIERFEITCKKTQSRLDQLKQTFSRVEPLSSIEEIGQIKVLHRKVVEDIIDDITCSKEIAGTLEGFVKTPFTAIEITPLTQYNYDYLMKWTKCLGDMKLELESAWESHSKYLADSVVVCEFERDYGVVSKEILRVTAEVKDRKNIGQTNLVAERLMEELISFKENTKETYETIKELRDRGYKLIEQGHFSSQSIRMRCDEIKTLCDSFEDAVDERKKFLQANIDVHCCLEQLDSWYNRGMQLLASQSIEGFESAEIVERLLKEIQTFIENDQGLDMRKINRIKQLAKKLDDRDIDKSVEDALKRTGELTETMEKREKSLKKRTKERPVQPVKAIVVAKTSPQKPDNSPVLQQTMASAKVRKNSADFREKQKKDIDVVVTSRLQRRKMSFKKSLKRPFSTPVGKGGVNSSGEYEETDHELIKGTEMVMQELVDTERDYVQDLERVIEGYYKAFDDPGYNIPANMLGKKNIIFGNIEGIYRFHRTVFLEELQMCQKSPYLVGQIFLDKKEEFQFYAIYCKNKPHSEALRSELEKTSTFLKDCQVKLGHKLPLDSYLLKPVQRITKYQLLLNELMKYTSKRNPAYADLQDAHKAMRRILRNVNDVMHSTGLVGFPEEISEQGRLLYQDAFVVWNIHKNMLKQMTQLRGKHRQVFLYEKCIVFTKKEERETGHSKDGYVYQFKNFLKMGDVGLTEKVKDNPCKFEVWLQGRNEAYVLQSSKEESKDAWVAEIRKLLVEQLNSAKDPQRSGSTPNIHAIPYSAPPSDAIGKKFSFASLLSPPASALLLSQRSDGRRGSDNEMWRSTDSPTGVYLSPASAGDEADDSDSVSNWSDSEFDDDDDNDNGDEGGDDVMSSLDQEDSIGCMSISSDGKSEQGSVKRSYIAVADYTAVESSELSLAQGDKLELVQIGADGWWFVKNTLTASDGWTPAAYLDEQSQDSGIGIEDLKQQATSSVKVPKQLVKPRIETTAGLILGTWSVVSPHFVSSPSSNHCRQIGDARKGFSLSVYDTKIKQFLNASKSIDDCIKLACKIKDANYAIYDAGKCHALQCKKNACKISKDSKSKQTIVGLVRHESRKQKSRAVKQAGKRLKKGDKKHALSSDNIKATNAKVTAKDPSNWTLAFSTYVPPVIKTNPAVANVLDHNSKRQTKKPRQQQKQAKAGGNSNKHLVKTVKRKQNKVDAKNRNEVKKRTSKKKSKKPHPKLRRKNSNRGRKASIATKLNHKLIPTNHSDVNNQTRFTRDYPYSYAQYQYATPDNSYATQETDWRRSMIPTTADDLYSYYGDRRASLRSQLELPSPASDRTNIGSENDREVFSLPIANLVRRTDIPRGGLHHVSSVSVINDMLPDDDGMGKAAYLPSSASLSSYNDARDVIPADLSSPNVARFVAAPDTSTVIADTNGITNGMSGSHGIASTNGITDANGMASTNGMTDANAMANTNGITGENGISSYKVSSIDDKKQAAISQLPQVGVLEDVGAASVSGIESRQPLTEQESSRSPHSAKGVPDNVIQQALGVYPGYGSKVADANRHGDPAASNVAVAAYHQAPVSDVSMSNQPIKAPVSDISMSNQPIKSDDVDLDPTAQPQTAKLFPVESLAYTGLANSSKTVLSVTTKDSASSAVDGTRRVSTDPAEDNQSMESELMDPDHVAISKDKYHDFMKKVANLTTFANVLPAKHVASAVHDNHAYRDATMKTASASPSSVEVGPIGLSSDINPATTNPVNSLLAAVIKASSVGASKETSSLPLVSSSLSSLNPRIAPSMSTPLESVQTFSTGLPLPMKKPQQNEIDAPLQNSILPVGKTTSQPPVQVEPPVEQAITATESDAKQGVKPAAVVSVDLPFPARLVLPVPSQSPAQPLSGLSVLTSVILSSEIKAHVPIHSTPVPTPVTDDTNGQITSSSSTATLRLLKQPTFSVVVAAPTSSSAVSVSSTQQSLKTALPTTGPTDTDVPSGAPTKNAVLSIDTPDSEGPPLPTQRNAQPTDQHVGPTSDVTTNVPLTDRPIEDWTSPTATVKPNAKPTNSTGTAKALPLVKAKTQHVIYKQTTLTEHKAVVITNNTRTTPANTLTNARAHAQKTQQNQPQKTATHITPGSSVTANDNTMKHITPLAKPKLKLSNNGSVVVLNNVNTNTKKPGLTEIYQHYQLDAKIKAELRLRQLGLFKSSKGCSEALGISTSEIRNEQLSASSQLSPQFGPARARIGLQSDKQGNAGGWCSDPRQNDRPQYLQVDYKVDQDVCRIAIQGLDRARSWVSYYKLAFSSNGVHWSVYKEGGKEKVFQGNVDQDDFTSYRLIDPIKARFIRIVPQSWEGRSICLRTEMYNDNIVYNRGSKLYGRSSIPSALQGMIDHLTFEKLDDVVVFDSSSMGNNAFLNNGAAVYDTHGKCRHAARIGDGSDVLLDGRNMRVLPREAISISTWVRVDQTEGVHSIFDTVGAHSRHELGQYHFEIVGGAVRWFHRNENATQIFSAITEPNLINPKEWTHIVASYDSTTGEAKIYVNGSRVVDAKGQGLLSQDWAGRVGIGRHKDTRDLVGNIDEFRIYAEAIQGEKIMELARECVFDKYYCGSLLTAEQGILITPDYPALHKGPVKCVWEIKGLPGEVISLDIKELDLHDCNRSKFDVKDAANGSILASYCGNDSKPGHVSSHSNQMIIEFNSDGRGNGERFKVEFQREKVRATKKTMSSVCKNSDVYQNVTLVGGSKAGTFTDLGSVDDMKTCQEKCCEKETCEVSFMIAGNCYAVRCFDQEQCKLRKAKSSSLNPMISFISREGIPTRISPIFVDKNSSPVVVNSPKAQPIVAKSECKSSSVHYNSTLVKGMQSGNFTSRGSVEDFPRCLDLCCQSGNCDAAFLVKKTCFSVQCYSKESCNAKAARPSPFNPTLAYIIRDNGASKALADDIQGAAKSSVTKLSGVCAKSRISKIYQNITLKDGVKSGEFTDHGDVRSMNDCLKHCCSDDNCNLAFVIKTTCFTVKCRDYDSCSLKSAVSKYYNPRIAFVNWNPPRQNLGDGDVRYDYKGCWKDFDMSAFALPLLEGTDAALTGPYKRRQDPVNDCATVVQNRGYSVFAIQNGGACFSGANAETTYKRYGQSDACKGGRGGAFANSVYKLFEDGSVMSLGCWADLQDRAFRRLEKIDTDLQDSYINRANPIQICAKVARHHKANTFALQKGGQCFIGKGASPRYEKYGPSRKCKYGLGGQMANDVYFLKDLGNSVVVDKGDAVVLSQAAMPVKPAIRNLTLDDKPSDSSNLGTGASSLQPGEVVYKEQLTDTEHIRYVYSAGEIMPNVTVASGIKAGTFTDKGAIERMEDCVRSCGETSDCNVAFKLGKQCFSVACFHKDTCATKPAFSAFYNPLVAFVKHRIVRTERQKEQPLTDINPTQRSLCKAKKNVANVTLVDGIGAGNFTDLGHVSHMDDCVSRCCSDSSCELAFKIEDDCYGVTCYSEKSCRTRSARNSMTLRPAIAYVRDVGSRKVFQTSTSFKDDSGPKLKPEKPSTCTADVWDGEIKENVTLVGGVNAGDFTDHGQTDSFNECMNFCCDSKECDLAFMIDNDCYGVKCKDPNNCRTRAARPTKYRPMIAFKKSTETVPKAGNAGLNLFEVSSNKPDSRPLDQRKTSSVGVGLNDGVMHETVPVLSVASVMFKDRKPVEDSTSKSVDRNRFEPRAYYSQLTTSSPDNLTKLTTTAKPTLTVIPRPPKGTTPGFSSTAMKSTFTATPTFGDPSSKHSCLAGPIIYNDTLRMGMHSGLFTKLGRVNKMDDCIERCCKSSNADVAFMLGPVCFAVKCYSAELCKTSPAMVSNIGDLNMNPTLSFLKKKEATMANGNDIDVIIDEITDKIDGSPPPSITPNRISGLSYNDLYTSLENISTAWEVYNRARTRPIPRAPAILAPGGTCTDSPITYNVTLKGGIHAGNFTNHGEGLTPRECVGKCCDQKSCDLAFMFADLCYSVKCRSDDDCQAVVAKPSNLSPKVSFVTRNRIPIDRETMFDVALDRPEDDTCEQENVEHSPIQVNRTLVGGLNAGNFSYLGKTKSMRECLGKCCSSKKCDVAYRIDRECFSVKCYSPDLCKVTDAPVKNGFVQFATMSRKDNLRRINTQSIAIYVIIGVLCFTVGITAIGWAMCMYMKRKNKKSQQQQTDDKPMPDQISDKPER